jgi:hypothetical protein
MTDEITKVFIEDAMKDLEPYEGKYLGCSSCDYEYNYEWRSETPKFCPSSAQDVEKRSSIKSSTKNLNLA